VSGAIEHFLTFAKDKAEVLANCGLGACPPGVLSKADYAVVFGGDGTILTAASCLRGSNIPVIGVNVGKLGFLAEFSPKEVEDLFDRIVRGDIETERRMMLHCVVTHGGRQTFSAIAINDVVITAGPPFSMVELRITVSGQDLANCISDGVIISTPTGSTAYNLSAGGPILEANISAIVITPMCPHSLSFRPIVIGAECDVRVEAVRVNPGTTVMVDGRTHSRLEASDTVQITREGGAFLVVNNPVRTKWDTLAEKLGWGENPRYNPQRDSR
jgi:NAD+ kinase